MADPRRIFGDLGEAKAANYLKSKGLVVVQKQYRTPFGEIDLICLDGDEVVFVEVKTRKTRTFGLPEESVTHEKIKHIVRSAEFVLDAKHWTERPWRVDVVAVEQRKGDFECVHFIGIDIPGDFC
jgi:putative endonuclease